MQISAHSAFTLSRPTQQELSEPSCLFDLSEHRLDDLLSQPVATSPSGPSELQAHGLGEATGEVALVLPGMLGPPGGDVGGDAALSQSRQIGLATVAGVGRRLLRPPAEASVYSRASAGRPSRFQEGR